MKITGFIWLKGIVEKIEKEHHILQRETEEVFKNKPKFLFKEKGMVEGENLYNALGQTKAGRYISVFFIYKKGGKVLIISARKMNQKERKFYGKK